MDIYLYFIVDCMKNYELVLMLNASTSETERKEFLEGVESKCKVLDKDEIGVQKLYYTLKGGIQQAYFVSYNIEAEENNLAEIRAYLKYNAMILKYDIFARSENQEFFFFEKLQPLFDKTIEEIKDKKYGQKVVFFTKEENEKYLNWKSIAILKYYLTRFGTIKPRFYTGNSVKIQKKLRKEIIRARGLGLLPFINH
ncbi:30S ribosomal protein S18 [bacterium]|nr:30S ribosomal protein S18 [bacterium]